MLVESNLRVKINVPEASSITVAFNKKVTFDVSNKQTITAYNIKATRCFLPFTNKNNRIIKIGDGINEFFVEYYINDLNDFDENKFQINKLVVKRTVKSEQSKKKLNTLAGCFVDVSCSGGLCVQNESGAVVKMENETGTGALINNLKNDSKLLVLTGNHVIAGVIDITSSIFEFNVKSNECDSTELIPAIYSNIYTGKQILCQDSLTDFALIELDDDPAMDNTQLTYAGWSRDTLLTALNYCISHPMDAILTNPQLLAHHLPLIH